MQKEAERSPERRGRSREGTRLDFDESPLDQRSGRKGAKSAEQKRDEASRTPARSQSKSRGRSLGDAARRLRLTEAITPEAPRTISMEVEGEDQTNVASNNADGSNKADTSNKEGLIASLNDAAGAVSEQEEARRRQEQK